MVRYKFYIVLLYCIIVAKILLSVIFLLPTSGKNRFLPAKTIFPIFPTRGKNLPTVCHTLTSTNGSSLCFVPYTKATTADHVTLSLSPGCITNAGCCADAIITPTQMSLIKWLWIKIQNEFLKNNMAVTT